jgi:hypothetical protein
MWKDIDANYEISDNGWVLSKRNGIILKPRDDQRGYLGVNLGQGSGRSKKIHQLVARAFIPNPENKPVVDHINGNRYDNRVENLRWATYKENANNTAYTRWLLGHLDLGQLVTPFL